MSEQIIRQVHKSVVTMARRFAKGHAYDTEDFAQDGVMAVLECCRRYPLLPTQDLVKACVAAARNAMISNVRKAARRGDVPLEDKTVKDDIADIASSRELYLLIRSGLSKNATMLLDEALSPAASITTAARGSVKDADYARYFGVSKPTVCRARSELRSRAESLGLSL